MRNTLRLALAIAFLAVVSAPSMEGEAGRQVRPPRPARVSKSRFLRKVAHKGRTAVRPRFLFAARPSRQKIVRPRRIVQPGGNPIESLPPAPRGRSRIVFGVMGGAGDETPAELDAMLEKIGARIAKGDHVTLTGACPGLPESAARGARANGGLTVGISSYRTLEEHIESGSPTDFDVMQLTDLPLAHRGQDRPNYMGREIDNIERSDVIVIAGGRFGTLGELAIALEEGRPIGVLTGSGGIADIVRDIVDASTRAGKPPAAPVIYESDPVKLVARLEKAHADLERDGRVRRGPLGDGFREGAGR